MLELVKKLSYLLFTVSTNSTVLGNPFKVIQRLSLTTLYKVLNGNISDILTLADNLGNLLLERIVPILFYQVVVNSCTQPLIPKDGTVELVIRKPAKGISDRRG